MEYELRFLELFGFKLVEKSDISWSIVDSNDELVGSITYVRDGKLFKYITIINSEKITFYKDRVDSSSVTSYFFTVKGLEDKNVELDVNDGLYVKVVDNTNFLCISFCLRTLNVRCGSEVLMFSQDEANYNSSYTCNYETESKIINIDAISNNNSFKVTVSNTDNQLPYKWTTRILLPSSLDEVIDNEESGVLLVDKVYNSIDEIIPFSDGCFERLVKRELNEFDAGACALFKSISSKRKNMRLLASKEK